MEYSVMVNSTSLVAFGMIGAAIVAHGVNGRFFFNGYHHFSFFDLIFPGFSFRAFPFSQFFRA